MLKNEKYTPFEYVKVVKVTVSHIYWEDSFVQS